MIELESVEGMLLLIDYNLKLIANAGFLTNWKLEIQSERGNAA
ncbi:MAG: hypothetical protein ACI9EW_004216 [Cellvibrionaceae bacterium]|jgi:hypothetical protein